MEDYIIVFNVLSKILSLFGVPLLIWRVNYLTKQNNKLSEELRGYSNALTVTSLIDNEIPYPRVMKTLDRRVIWVNKAYTEEYIHRYGRKLEDYLGKHDADFWGVDTDRIFEAVEKWVLLNKRPKTKNISVMVDGNQISGKVTVFPQFDNLNNLTAIGVIVNKDYN